jgi:serine/threonine-protein kinase
VTLGRPLVERGTGFAPGAVLAGRFRIVSLLGRGGMGEVYRAEDLKLGQAVALKFLPDPIDQKKLARFYAEVRLGRQVAHPNVCRIYDVIEGEGRHFLVMEYVDGEDLASLLRRIGRLPQDKGLEIARGLCAGLAAAHEKGILHRDLKPANVMLDGRGHPRIMDFGLAMLAGDAGEDRHAGTPAYMAPEQLKGEELTVRSDLYSLGLVLYEVFTGRRAWDAGSMSELLKARSESTPTAPSSLVTELDRGVERVILSCLARDAASRPSTAIAVQAALPGGDPLQAAIALGETPSPEMVAAAAVVGDLNPKAAWAWLAAAALALAGVLTLGAHGVLHRLVPLPKSPEVLLDRARTLSAKLAPGEAIADSAYGIDADVASLRAMAEREGGRRQPCKQRAAARPGPLLFWYRASREPLVARTWEPQPPWMAVPRTIGRVTRAQPPPSAPGMQEIVLDPSGRLIGWQRVPASGDPPDPDLQATLGFLLAEAGLEAAKLTREPPASLATDQVIAWHGPFPDAPGRARGEATISAARVARFAVARGDVANAPEASFGISSMTLEITLRLVLLLGLPMLVGAGVLFVRNLRLKRGDRRGAFRIAAFGAATAFLALKLRVHFPASIGDAFDLWVVSDAQPFYAAILGWFYYIALEPELRRNRPHLLVSWSRLLAGRFRDPLVGRDVLLGVTAGLTWALIWVVGLTVPDPGGLPPAIPLVEPVVALASIREACAVLLQFLYPAMVLALAWGVGAFVLFRITGSRAMSVFVLWLLFFWILTNFVDNAVAAILMATLGATLVTTVVFRLGLLGSAVMTYTCFTQIFLPSTTDLSAWYAGTAALALAPVVLLAGYGFWVSLAGKPPFGRAVMQA